MWTNDVFEADGNKIGEFLEACMFFITSRTRRVARVLVKLNPLEGLFEKIKLSYEGGFHLQ